jgi:error-prone DNA polymerase
VDAIAHPRLKALLNSHSYFSFGAGTSSPTRLVERAVELGYEQLALTDHLGVYGAVELHRAAREAGLGALIGATVPLDLGGETYPLVLLAGSRRGYRALNDLLSAVHAEEERRATLPMLASHSSDLHALTGGRRGFPTRLLAERRVRDAERALAALKDTFHDRLWVQLFFDHYPRDAVRARALRAFARSARLATVAAPEVRYATPEQYPLYDALVCARLGITVDDPHRERPQNDRQAIPAPSDLPLPFPEAIENANTLARELTFDLLPERLAPPAARVPAGLTPDQYLEERCLEALLHRYDGEMLSRARLRLEQELITLRALSLSEFFLTAAEVTDYCRSRGIVSSGRGSAAASVICYLLGITGADPIRHDLLFERFLHTGRSSMPDIDIDIGSARRDEVLDWVERHWPQEAMVCNRITYRLPLAIQDLARALGVPPKMRNDLTRSLGRDYRGLRPHRAAEARPVFSEVLGDAPVAEVLLDLLAQLERGFVRHIAPHSGGVVLSREPIAHYSPVERSSGGIRLLQFDKDDAEALGLIKLDLLGLRMLAALERCREDVHRLEGVWLDLHDLPDDPRVWAAIREGDTMGIFQIESPGQVRMSVQMQPRTMTDLAHQIALFRPGPIQSNTVHPYIRRRRGLERVTYPHPALEPLLGNSYGVVLFQEQVLRIAVHFAGFSWAEAEHFRKLVSSYEDNGEIARDRRAFLEGAQRTVGASEAEAATVFDMVSQFRGYGFAESHAWAFAQHAYAGAYLRLHHPSAYLAAILSESPGMWSGSTLRQEAKRWGVPFARLDIDHSGSSYRVERDGDELRVRPPLSAVKGVSTELATDIMLERLHGRFAGVADLFERVAIPRDALESLARAGAFDRFEPRREALYRVAALTTMQPAGERPLLRGLPPTPALPQLELWERVVWDHDQLGFNPQGIHPIDLMRRELLGLGATPIGLLPGGFVRTAGLVISKQKPPTANGYAFFVLEDGPERLQLVIAPELWTQQRNAFRDAPVLLAEGELYREGRALCLRAERVWGLEGAVRGEGYHYG